MNPEAEKTCRPGVARVCRGRRYELVVNCHFGPRVTPAIQWRLVTGLPTRVRQLGCLLWNLTECVRSGAFIERNSAAVTKICLNLAGKFLKPEPLTESAQEEITEFNILTISRIQTDQWSQLQTAMLLQVVRMEELTMNTLSISQSRA